MKTNLTDFISIDDRDPASVRAVILARKSSNGSEGDVTSQVEECQRFIKRMGWTLVADPYAYTEVGKSGHYNVVRKVLEAVLALAQQRKVDVIVARAMERLDRDKDRRAFAIGFCDRYDVEWRFANLTPNGKFPDTLDGKMIAAMKKFYGLIEAEESQRDLMQDFVAIITWFCAQLYGRRRASRKKTQMLATLEVN
jgi:predicted site-specific integrase-resolvase